jgi:hypothetical protein
MLIDIVERKYKDNITFYHNDVFICNRHGGQRYHTKNITEKVEDAVQNCYTLHLFGEGGSNNNVGDFNKTLIGSLYYRRMKTLNKTDYYDL